MDMTWLLLATGFTGALTLVFLVRQAHLWWAPVPSVSVYFSPKGGCTDAIVAELKQARQEILVQAYSFTSDPITYGLIDAKKRGVDVKILLDRSNEEDPRSDLRLFLEHGLAPLIDAEHAIARIVVGAQPQRAPHTQGNCQQSNDGRHVGPHQPRRRDGSQRGNPAKLTETTARQTVREPPARLSPHRPPRH